MQTPLSQYAEPDFTELRRGDLDTLVAMLRRQHDVKYDVVVEGRDLAYTDAGLLAVKGGAVDMSNDGLTTLDALLAPTDSFESHVAQRLRIPRDYLRRMRTSSKLPLLAANVNTWLLDEPERRYFVRAFRDDDPTHVGVARALLSDSFDVGMDHLDALLAALDGVRAADAQIVVESAELTGRTMRLNVFSPSVHVIAEQLLAGYRSPFEGDARRAGRGGALDLTTYGDYEPHTVFAGWQLANSETGHGAFTIVPRFLVKVCGNGLVVKRDAMRKVHLGAKLDKGVVRWSGETRKRNVELVRAQARDVVQRFLDVDYVQATIDSFSASAATPVSDATSTIERVARSCSYTEAEQTAILDHFIAGGQLTAGGVLQAVTSVAQTLDDGDRAAELEASALDACFAAAGC